MIEATDSVIAGKKSLAYALRVGLPVASSTGYVIIMLSVNANGLQRVEAIEDDIIGANYPAFVLPPAKSFGLPRNGRAGGNRWQSLFSSTN
jgi:hypothetical protein